MNDTTKSMRAAEWLAKYGRNTGYGDLGAWLYENLDIVQAALASQKATVPEPSSPADLRQPWGWAAITDTAGVSEGCDKCFCLEHEARDYVRLHGGYIAPLFRHYAAAPAADQEGA